MHVPSFWFLLLVMGSAAIGGLLCVLLHQITGELVRRYRSRGRRTFHSQSTAGPVVITTWKHSAKGSAPPYYLTEVSGGPMDGQKARTRDASDAAQAEKDLKRLSVEASIDV